MKNSSSSSNEIGFWGMLVLVFIVLKLVGVISWPWIWVLAPIWGGMAIGLLLVAGIWIFVKKL